MGWCGNLVRASRKESRQKWGRSGKRISVDVPRDKDRNNHPEYSSVVVLSMRVELIKSQPGGFAP